MANNIKDKIACVCNNIKNSAKKFWKEEDGMGVVEIVLIIVEIFTGI